MASSATLKRAAMGACFLGNMQKLKENQRAQTVWEIDIVTDVPAHLRPTKPKFWLMGSCTLENGKYYKLC